MKKIIYVVSILTIMFLGISGVEAADPDFGPYSGECNLTSSNGDTCNYSCVVKSTHHAPAGDYHDSIKFNYTYKSDNTHNIVVTETATDNVIYSYSHIYGPVTADGVTVSNVSEHISETIAPSYFVVDGNFKCRKIIPSVGVTTSSTGGVVAKMSYQRYFSFKIAPGEIIDEANKHNKKDYACGILGDEDSKTVLIMRKIYGYVKVFVPIIIVILGVVDFLKVVLSGKDDDMKKSINKLIKRVIIGVIFVLVPLLVSMIIDISGLANMYNGVNSGLKAVVCILK